MQRIQSLERNTKETQISLTLNLDGSGKFELDCPVGFFSHMLQAFCKHGLFDLSGKIAGDLHVDQHHLIEDTGIVLGTLFDKALGNKAGIRRAGCFSFPMDETLGTASVDFGGRSFLVCNVALSGVPLVGGFEPTSVENQNPVVTTFQTDTFEDFWQGFVSGAKCNLHLDIVRGRSDHHKMESLFKAASRAMRDAVSLDSRLNGAIPSTKGVL